MNFYRDAVKWTYGTDRAAATMPSKSRELARSTPSRAASARPIEPARRGPAAAASCPSAATSSRSRGASEQPLSKRTPPA